MSQKYLATSDRSNIAYEHDAQHLIFITEVVFEEMIALTLAIRILLKCNSVHVQAKVVLKILHRMSRSIPYDHVSEKKPSKE